MFQNRVHTSVTQLLRKVPVIVFSTIFIKALCHRDIEGMISYDIIPRTLLTVYIWMLNRIKVRKNMCTPNKPSRHSLSLTLSIQISIRSL